MCPRVLGKSIRDLSLSDAPGRRREVWMQFNYSIQPSVFIGVKQTVDAGYRKEDNL